VPLIQPAPRNKVFLEKFLVIQLDKKQSASREPEGFSECLQKPATVAHPEPAESNPPFPQYLSNKLSN